MNVDQKSRLLEVADKMAMISYSLSVEYGGDVQAADPAVVYDLAFELSKLEALLLTIPHLKETKIAV